jgi:hypothetical protein
MDYLTRSFRLDNEVYDAIRAMPVSLNVYLREQLIDQRLATSAQLDRIAANTRPRKVLGDSCKGSTSGLHCQSCARMNDACCLCGHKAESEYTPEIEAKIKTNVTPRVFKGPLLKPGERK